MTFIRCDNRHCKHINWSSYSIGFCLLDEIRIGEDGKCLYLEELKK